MCVRERERECLNRPVFWGAKWRVVEWEWLSGCVYAVVCEYVTQWLVTLCGCGCGCDVHDVRDVYLWMIAWVCVSECADILCSLVTTGCPLTPRSITTTVHQFTNLPFTSLLLSYELSWIPNEGETQLLVMIKQVVFVSGREWVCEWLYEGLSAWVLYRCMLVWWCLLHTHCTNHC